MSAGLAVSTFIPGLDIHTPYAEPLGPITTLLAICYTGTDIANHVMTPDAVVGAGGVRARILRVAAVALV